jgi:rhodanese-related sulfurtransferase
MSLSPHKLAMGLVIVGGSISGWAVYSHTNQASYEYISAPEVDQYRAQEYQLLDFRTPTEHELGTLTPTTFVIDITSATSVASELDSLDPRQGYIIYDRNGDTIADVVSMLKAVNFTDIKILEGGYQAWVTYTGR